MDIQYRYWEMGEEGGGEFGGYRTVTLMKAMAKLSLKSLCAFKQEISQEEAFLTVRCGC